MEMNQSCLLTQVNQSYNLQLRYRQFSDFHFEPIQVNGWDLAYIFFLNLILFIHS